MPHVVCWNNRSHLDRGWRHWLYNCSRPHHHHPDGRSHRQKLPQTRQDSMMIMSLYWTRHRWSGRWSRCNIFWIRYRLPNNFLILKKVRWLHQWVWRGKRFHWQDAPHKCQASSFQLHSGKFEFQFGTVGRIFYDSKSGHFAHCATSPSECQGREVLFISCWAPF